MQAKVIAHAFDSARAVQYFPGDVMQVIYDESERQSVADVNLSDYNQRKLVWLRTPRGRWIFDFDRANASEPQIGMWFCKECGQPFDRLNAIGTHNNEFHKNSKVEVVEESEPESDEPIVVEKRGKKKKTGLTCKVCSEVLPHPYAMRKHHETAHAAPVVTEEPSELLAN